MIDVEEDGEPKALIENENKNKEGLQFDDLGVERDVAIDLFIFYRLLKCARFGSFNVNRR